MRGCRPWAGWQVSTWRLQIAWRNNRIRNPTLLACISRAELEQLLRGYGWTPYFVEGHEPGPMHEAMAATLDTAVEQIKTIQSPKGWTAPKRVDGLQIEGTFRSHQVPLSDPATHPAHLKLLEEWLRSYRAQELFDERPLGNGPKPNL